MRKDGGCTMHKEKDWLDDDKEIISLPRRSMQSAWVRFAVWAIVHEDDVISVIGNGCVLALMFACGWLCHTVLRAM